MTAYELFRLAVAWLMVFGLGAYCGWGLTYAWVLGKEADMVGKPGRCPGCDELLTRGDYIRGYCPWCGWDLTTKGRKK